MLTGAMVRVVQRMNRAGVVDDEKEPAPWRLDAAQLQLQHDRVLGKEKAAGAANIHMLRVPRRLHRPYPDIDLRLAAGTVLPLRRAP